MAVPPQAQASPGPVEQKGGQNLGIWAWILSREVNNLVDNFKKLTLGTFSLIE